MMQERLRVVVLSYNRADALRDCIDSFQKQTFEDFSLIILDNASDGSVEEAVKKYNDPRIRFIRNSENIGNIENFEKAWSFAVSEYFMVFHDDDCAHPRLLQEQIRVLDAHPDTAFVLTGCNLVYDDSRMKLFNVDETVRYELFENAKTLVKAYLTGKHFGFCSAMYRVNSALRVDEAKRKALYRRFALCADRPFLISIAANTRCAYMESPTYNVRMHEGQDSTRLASEHEYVMEVFRYYAEILGVEVDRDSRDKLNYLVTVNILTAYRHLIRKRASNAVLACWDLLGDLPISLSALAVNIAKIGFRRLRKSSSA